jgi:hypothetical protein
MYTGIETHRSVEGALAKADYIADAKDPNHVSKVVQAEWIGCANEFEFALELQSVKRGDGKIRRGPKVQICAYEFLVRSPYQSPVAPDELELIKRITIEKVGIAIGRFGRHTDIEEACVDTHLIGLNRGHHGRPLSARNLGNLYFRFRKAIDYAHDEINRMRRAKSIPEIPTMKTVRDAAREIGRADLVKKLAASDTELDVESVIIFLKNKDMLGQRLRTKGDEKDYISIIYPPKAAQAPQQPRRRPRRPSGQRELIQPLLQAVQQLRRLRAKSVSVEQPKQDDQDKEALTPQQRKARVEKIKQDIAEARDLQRKREKKAKAKEAKAFLLKPPPPPQRKH